MFGKPGVFGVISTSFLTGKGLTPIFKDAHPSNHRHSPLIFKGGYMHQTHHPCVMPHFGSLTTSIFHTGSHAITKLRPYQFPMI